jgi:uncharacterized RmlC-like cupin family protein
MSRHAESLWFGEGQGSGVDPRNRFMGGAAGLLERALGLAPGVFCLDTACASSLVAIKLACDQLHDRSVDLVLAGAVNRALIAGFQREKDGPEVRRTHMFGGRYENTYIARRRLPELAPLTAFVLAAAAGILRTGRLHHGFWFNEMPPGHGTSLHSHEELDELLSAVYYLQCPDHSGRLILHDQEAQITVTPRPGLLVLFPPYLPHEVEPNRSRQTRLSVAFNFGPADSAT